MKVGNMVGDVIRLPYAEWTELVEGLRQMG